MTYTHRETNLMGKVTQCKRRFMVARDIVRRRMAAATFPIGIMEHVVFQGAEQTKKTAL